MLKTLRDIRETIGSFISILIVIFIGCFFFAGVAEGSSSMTNRVNGYYDMTNYASARGEYMFVNSVAVDEIAGAEGVEKAAGYNTFYTKTRKGGVRYDLSLTTLTAGIDEPYMISGRLPASGAPELIVDEVFAKAHGLKEKDKLTFDIATLKSITLMMTGDAVQYFPEYVNVRYTFEVVGVYHSPDVIRKVDIMNTAAQPDEFIMAYTDYSAVAAYTADAEVVMPGGLSFKYASIPDGVKIYNGIKIIGDVADAEELFGAYKVSTATELYDILFVDSGAAAGLYMYCMERDSFPSVQGFNGINDTIAALAAVLPLIFFAVAAAITVISLSKTVENQRMQIGVIQALGVEKSKVYFSYIFYALFASVVGGLLGGLVGTYFIPFLLDYIYAWQFCMPPTPWRVRGLYLVLGVVISAALACLAAFLSCYKTLRVRPAQAMRPKPPKKTKRILAERWTWLWRRLDFGAKMNLRNMFLHKLRMLLSAVGIVGCIALLIGLIGLKDNMAHSLDCYDSSACYDLTIITDAAVDLKTVDLDDIAGHKGAEYIDKLTFVPDFSGRFSFGDKTADRTVMALPTATDAQKYKYADPDCIKVYTDENRKYRSIIEDGSFIVPQALADELGAKAGDIVHVTGYSLDNRPVAFDIEITEVVCEYFEQKAYCSYSVFENNGVGLYADMSYAKAKAGVALSDAVDLLLADSDTNHVRDVKSFAESFAALKNQMSLLDYAVVLFVIGAAVLAVAVIYNITATNLKDRTREIATLMVLGYKPHETAAMIIVENLVITAIGCILGLPLGYGLLRWLVNITTSFNVFISGFMSWYIALGCIALTFAFSLLATLLLNRKMKGISMVEALKSVE